ncbi:hypothetical protein [Streptomyces sp. Ag109_G2-15]|uniref:hypothetical protein n=1 Tax=Streptomyces sp. Ag109_G2-15 TaxID=1938850 RepID=UPI000CA73CE6|nr:hypothetical protein [Streptomyces sp. Ag109_G2-15]
MIARSEHPVVLFESGFAPRWYVPRADIGEARRAAWTYRDAYREADRISDLVSCEPDKAEVYLDGTRLRLEPGQNVIAHGVDRGLDVDEVKAG